MPNNTKLSPINTRSNSSTLSSAKTSSSNDDILKAIERLHLTQDKLLAGHKSLGNELKSSINALTLRFDALAGEISELKTKVVLLESKVVFLENNLSKLDSCNLAVNQATENQIVDELLDRQFRSKNILIFNLTDDADHSTNDVCTTKEILSAMDLDYNPVKVVRLGRKSDKPRPLKIVLPEINDVFSVLKNKKKLQSHSTFNSIRISSDKTSQQRNHFNSIRRELDERKSNGELDLSIRYVRGSPTIVKNSKNL